MRRFTLVVSAMLFTGAVFAQSASSASQSPSVLALLVEAETARLALKFDVATARVDDAIALAERTGDKSGLAAAHRMKGAVFTWSGRPADAMTWLIRARDEFEALGDRRGVGAAMMSLTSAAISAGQGDQARAFGATAIQLFKELGDESGRATVLINLASAADGTRPDDPRIDEVLAIADRLRDDNLKATALKVRGGRQYADGDFAAANATLESAAAAYVRSNDVAGAAASYLMIGRIHRAHNDFDGALGYYQRAIDMLAPTSERYTLVEAVNASAVALGLMGKQREAIAAYQRGLALARESGNARLIDFMLGNLGGGLAVAGQYAQAIPVLQEVLARNPEPYIASFRYNQLAIAFVHVGRVTDAVAPIDESIRITRELKQVEMLDSRLDDRAWILRELGRYEEALASSREALALVEQARARLLPTDFLKRGYGDRVQLYYARGVDLQSRLGQGPDALELSEQGRSRAFLDLLAARETGTAELTTRGVTPSRGDGGAASPLRSDAMGRPANSSEMIDIAKRLDSAIVTFWVDKDVTLAWVVTPDGRVRDTRLAIGRDRLSSLVAATTAPLRNSAESAVAARGSADDITALPLRGLGLLALSRDDRSAWRELYRLLIDPLRSSLPGHGGRLTIVPHGPLFPLAFAALQSADGRYLIEDYDVSVAPSISVLAFTGRRQEAERSAPPGPWMLVGNPAALPTINDHALAPLPGAAQELAAIAALAPRSGVIRLEADRADETALAGALEAAHPAVVHFATHGFVPADPKTPPFLVLNRRGDAAAEDGRLTMDEIYELRLSSDLVVLSACRSGGGAISSDGVVGLARAFFYAGAPSVMATLWDVPDATTALLMPRFYRRYAATREKSASLRAAQLALLADLRAGRVSVTASGTRVTLPEHPLLWAGFVVVGEPGNGPKPSKGVQ